MIKLIRGSKDPEAARDGLIEQIQALAEQAQAILDMRLQRLTALEADKIKEEHAELVKKIKRLRAILADESKVLGLIKRSSPRSPRATATSAAPRSSAPKATSTSRT